MRRMVLFAMIAGALTACVHSGSMPYTQNPVPRTLPVCAACDSLPMSPEIAKAIEARIADLAARGGDCATYGAVLAQTYSSGRITVRPYMWRVTGHLTSGEAHTTGEIAMAQEIDSLNVGVRTIAEMTWTVEHEAAHLAFHIPSHGPEDEAAVNGHVRACRPDSAVGPR